MDFSKFSNHLCLTHEEKITAYNIRYQAYTDVDYEPLSGSGLYKDDYDEESNHFTFLLKDQGKPIATARVSVKCADLEWPAFPCERGFVEKFAELSKKHPVIVEIGRLAVLPEVRGMSSIAPLALYANAFAFTAYFDDILMVCASGKKHKRFYERLGLTQETPFAPRPHCAIDLCLMTVPLKIAPFLEQTMMERSQLDDLMPNLSPIFRHHDTAALRASA